MAGLDTGRWSDLAHAPDTLDRHSEVLESFVGHVARRRSAPITSTSSPTGSAA